MEDEPVGEMKPWGPWRPAPGFEHFGTFLLSIDDGFVTLPAPRRPLRQRLRALARAFADVFRG